MSAIPSQRRAARPWGNGASCQCVIHQGTKPATVPGATTKKRAEPSDARSLPTSLAARRLLAALPAGLPLRHRGAQHDGSVVDLLEGARRDALVEAAVA